MINFSLIESPSIYDDDFRFLATTHTFAASVNITTFAFQYHKERIIEVAKEQCVCLLTSIVLKESNKIIYGSVVGPEDLKNICGALADVEQNEEVVQLRRYIVRRNFFPILDQNGNIAGSRIYDPTTKNWRILTSVGEVINENNNNEYPCHY